jgi:FHA domain
MIARLVALDGGRDILIDQDMVVVGRHPSCDARLDSLRLSRHHCYSDLSAETDGRQRATRMPWSSSGN